MSKTYSLKATKRADQGKGASRRLRHTGGVPAIVYGAGTEPLSITLNHNELTRNLQEEAFYSQLIALDVDGTIETVVLRDLQRHPAKVLIMHADLQRIQADHAHTATIREAQRVTVHYPLHRDRCQTTRCRAEGLGAGEPNRGHKKGARKGRLFHQHGKTETASQVDRP